MDLRNSAFTITSKEFESDIPGAINFIQNHSLQGGKRFRPLLMFKIAKCLGVNEDAIRPFALAAEKIHNATLLHDDVIDEAKSRRGKMTVNASGHNRKAVIAGDILLVRSLQLIDQHNSPAVMSELYQVLVELTEGEWLQLEARGVFNIEERQLNEVARKKTSSLIGWCCTTPAYIKKMDLQIVSSLRTFGDHLGLGFQLLDDCLDFNLKSGKPFCNDIKEGQVNFVLQNVIERYPQFLGQAEQLANGLSFESLDQSDKEEIYQSVKIIQKRARLQFESAKATIHASSLELNVKLKIEADIISLFPKAGIGS